MKIGFFFWPFNVALAFGAGYLIGDNDPLTRGVPPEHREAARAGAELQYAARRSKY